MILFVVLLRWITACAPLAEGYPTEVSVNPCGIPYPRHYIPTKAADYQAIRTLRTRIGAIIHHMKFTFNKDLLTFSSDEPDSWIPNSNYLDNILDVKTVLPRINRSLKFFSCGLSILEPHYIGNKKNTCQKIVENFQQIHQNHMMLVCETDEIMRIFGTQPDPESYPTLDVNIPENWVKMNSTNCTDNILSSFFFFKKYNSFLSRILNLLKL